MSESYQKVDGFLIDPKGVLVEYTGDATHIVIPSHVKAIGEGVFHNNENIVSVTFPDKLQRIGKDAFRCCRSLENIELPDSVKTLGQCAFSACRSLKNIGILKGIKTIPKSCFQGCHALESVVIEKNVESIGESAFSSCRSLKTIVIPETVTKLGKSAFSYCDSLEHITVGGGVATIEEDTFRHGRSLKTVTLHDGIQIIGMSAFCECMFLNQVIMPKTLLRIDRYAFGFCRDLVTVDLPASLERIDTKAFWEDLRDGDYEYIVAGLHLLYGLDELEDEYETLLQNEVVELRGHWPSEPLYPSKTYRVVAGSYAEKFVKKQKYQYEIISEGNTSAASEPSGKLIEKYINELLMKDPLKYASMGKDELEKIIKEKYLLDHPQQDTPAKTTVKKKKKTKRASYPVGSYILESHIAKQLLNELVSEEEIDQIIKEANISSTRFSDVKLRGGTEPAEEILVKGAVALYLASMGTIKGKIKQFRTKTHDVRIIKEADIIASALDPESFAEALEDIAKLGTAVDYPQRVLPYARFGTPAQLNSLIKMMKEWQNWGTYGAKGRKAIMLARGAILLNDSREAMTFAEKNELHDRYSELRDKDPNVQRATEGYEFGLDRDLKKIYQLGSAEIELSVDQDLKVTLFNLNSKKEIKSIPKKDVDSQAYKAASSDFDSIKRHVRGMITTLNKSLKRDFIRDNRYEINGWKTAYLDNPLMNKAARLIVWSYNEPYKKPQHFTLSTNGPMTVDGQAFTIGETGKIGLAHPIDMTEKEREEWQRYFTKNGLKQPFEQMWEPVIAIPDTQKRYSQKKINMYRILEMAEAGMEVSGTDFDFLAQGRKTTIPFSTEYWDRSYHYLAISSNASVTLGDIELGLSEKRFTNHILFILEKATIDGRIEEDDPSVIDVIRLFTAAQVEQYLQLALQENAQKVVAALLNLKNEQFGEFPGVDAFTLD